MQLWKWAFLVVQMVKNPPVRQETQVRALARRSPGEVNGYPLQYSCLENSQGQRSLVFYNPWGCKQSGTTNIVTCFHLKNSTKNQQMVLVQLHNHVQKNEARPLPHTVHKNWIDSKWIKDQDVSSKTMKVLGENMEIELQNLRFANRFLDVTSKAQATKRKIDQLGFIRMKSFVHQRRILSRKWKRQFTEGKKTFSNHISNRWLCLEYIKNLYNSIRKRQLNLKIGKRFE